MKIGHPKNFWGGVLFIVLGGLFALIAKGIPGIPFLPGYAMGTPARMGPAFFPFWLGLLLLILGVMIAVGGARDKDGGPESAFPTFHWGPILWVLGAVVVFGLILKWTGMLVAGFVLILIAARGSQDFELRRSVILGIVLSIFCAMVFVWGLKLPIPLCPDVEALQSSVGVCRG